MASDQRNPFNKSAIIKLQHLEPNTDYIVRSIIITINNKSFIDENLPHAAFTTKCYGTILTILVKCFIKCKVLFEEITDEDLISNSYNTSIKIIVKSKVNYEL
jgi:hypothetical protein